MDADQVVVEQSQESMVLQVSNDSVNNMPVDDFVIVQQPGAPLQPPLHIGQVLTVFGPVLPPDMLYQRSFQKMMPSLCFSTIPKFSFMSGFGSLLLYSKFWEVSFKGHDLSDGLMPVPASLHDSSRMLTPAKRPVARALCFDDISEPINETFEFTTAAPRATLKRERKKKDVILVETEVRRSAFLSALRDGFHGTKSPGLNRSPHTLKKRKTKSARADKDTSVPPPTAIADLQRIGARLRIAPEKITADKLVANPAQPTSSNSSDD